jgi:hypothetical protein
VDRRTEGSRELIVAVFRMAVTDYIGVSYGHDAPGRLRLVDPCHRSDAAMFLTSDWARTLADQVGLSAADIWIDSQRLRAALMSARQCG